MKRLPSQEGSGLKQSAPASTGSVYLSSLARGKWIEASSWFFFSFSWLSSLARGKWIEAQTWPDYDGRALSSLARGKWIEAFFQILDSDMVSSSLARGKWIEAANLRRIIGWLIVFPRKREVDWSTYNDFYGIKRIVFPRKREVDWSKLPAIIKFLLNCLPSQEGSGLKLQYVRVYKP